MDFKDMDFQDSRMYGWGVLPGSNQLLLDIDWTMKWEAVDGHYYFQIVPCTLVFGNAWDLTVDIVMNMNLIIDGMECRSIPISKDIEFFPPGSREYKWEIRFLQGSMSFKSIALSLYQRKHPLVEAQPFLTVEQRGFVSFAKEGVHHKINLPA